LLTAKASCLKKRRSIPAVNFNSEIQLNKKFTADSQRGDARAFKEKVIQLYDSKILPSE
jgi:hypothetical protein